MSNEIKVTISDVNEIKVKAERGVEGARGGDGKSAYELAVENGFVGTESQWINSLKGEQGLKGDGLEIISIYPSLLDLQTAHPTGTKGDCYAVGTPENNEIYFWDEVNEEWSSIGPIMGPPGIDGTIGQDGKSAYELAVENGFIGTEVEWLASLKGADGNDGIDGTNGQDGKSAYQAALDGGFVGTELEFNESLAEVENKQSILVSGTNIKTINGNPILGSGDLVIATSSDWNTITATLTYASADSPTFVANTSIDLTSVISVGMKLKLTQTTVKYFIVTAITSTTITLYGGTDYTLANASITLPYFSSMKTPYGFPLDRDKWTVITILNTNIYQSSAIGFTWYNINSASIVVPVGKWLIEYSVMAQSGPGTSQDRYLNVTLSTANNSQSNVSYSVGFAQPSCIFARFPFNKSFNYSNSSKIILYLNTMSDLNAESLSNLGGVSATIIKAVCAYL